MQTGNINQYSLELHVYEAQRQVDVEADPSWWFPQGVPLEESVDGVHYFGFASSSIYGDGTVHYYRMPGDPRVLSFIAPPLPVPQDLEVASIEPGVAFLKWSCPQGSGTGGPILEISTDGENFQRDYDFGRVHFNANFTAAWARVNLPDTTGRYYFRLRNADEYVPGGGARQVSLPTFSAASNVVSVTGGDVDLVAHRTGQRWGDPVTPTEEDTEAPDRLVVLTNNNGDEDSTGAHRDFDNPYRNDIDPLDDPAPVPSTPTLVSQNQERERFQNQSDQYFMFVHGWRMQEWERVAFAETAFKRMYWSGYKGQFGMFDWPTQWIEAASKDAGNFDRSEFIAWNSAQALFSTLRSVRSTSTVSVMAHSMGNIVLSEALYKNRLSQNPLVNAAIMSQAALSSHYFGSSTNELPSIYRTGVDADFAREIANHVRLRATNHSVPYWTEYKGFRPYGQDIDAIGGITPRFRNIGSAAEKVLNYYNPDDFALAGWRYGQAFKPAQEWSNLLTALRVKDMINLGNVDIPVAFEDASNWISGRDIPGFAETEYDFEKLAGQDRIVREYTGSISHPSVTLSYAVNKYEMFAFGASSTVAPLGAVPNTFPQIFAAVRDLSGLSPTKFNIANTGHSAQFIHSFKDVADYWRTLLKDIQ
ncbi:MAG TPA: alpha/beta hydrolase [Tepidisphaeraceae bacterium]